MNYLARLAQLETCQSPTDRTDKSTSVGFVSPLPVRIQTEPLPDPATSWRWLLHYPAGTQEVRFLPEVTRAQALESCPGSTNAEPIDDGAP